LIAYIKDIKYLGPAKNPRLYFKSKKRYNFLSGLLDPFAGPLQQSGFLFYGGFMILTERMLIDWSACAEGFEWWKKEGKKTVKLTTLKLIKTKHLNWANWLISRSLSNDNKVLYAIFAAKSVLCIYEKHYPGDLRPRKAIEAAEYYLKIKGAAARAAAGAAARAARDAAWAAAGAAARAARDARDAAWAAAGAAAQAAAWAAAGAAAQDAARDAAGAAGAAARDAARAAAWAAAWAAGAAALIKIIKYGLSLIDK
jgi:hypothetical protein